MCVALLSRDELALRIRHATDRNLFGIGKILLHGGAQFDFVAVAQKSRQRRIDQQRLGNLHRRAGVAAELIRFRLPDRDDAIRREIVRRDEIERRFAVGAGFQTALPKRERLKFLANIGDVRPLLLRRRRR